MTLVRIAYGLEDALTVANTAHGPGAHRGIRTDPDAPDHDHLRDPADARRFLVDHAIVAPASPPSRRHLARLEALRAVLHDATADRRGRTGAVEALLASVPARVHADGRVGSGRGGWDGLIDELTLPLLELAAAAPRLRRCRNALCRWVFVDRSRNASRRWCEMATCGNRAKGRRHRHRLR